MKAFNEYHSIKVFIIIKFKINGNYETFSNEYYKYYYLFTNIKYKYKNISISNTKLNLSYIIDRNIMDMMIMFLYITVNISIYLLY